MAINWNTINEAILAKLDVRAEYQALGVKFTGAGAEWLECHAVGRDDATPSAAVHVHTGRYKDHGGEGISLSLWDFAAQYGGFSDFKEARKHYAEKAGVQLPKGRPPARPEDKFTWDAAGWNAGNRALLDRWCEQYAPINAPTVIAAGARVAIYPKGGQHARKCLAIPVFGPPLWTDADPIAWVLQAISPQQQVPRFGEGGKVIDWLKRKSIGPVGGGLMGYWGLARMELRQEVAVLKVEGVTDMLTAMSILPPEERARYLVVSNAGGATENCTPATAKLFAGRTVYIVGDADNAGEVGAVKWATAIAPVAKVRIVKLFGQGFASEVKPSHGEDLRDAVTGNYALSQIAGRYYGAPAASAPQASGSSEVAA